jgi:hypothetical protein
MALSLSLSIFNGDSVYLIPSMNIEWPPATLDSIHTEKLGSEVTRPHYFSIRTRKLVGHGYTVVSVGSENDVNSL